MSLRFPEQPFSAAEWRRRWNASGLFRQETGAPTHSRVWWGTPRFCVTVHHSPHGHGAGGATAVVKIERVVFEERAQRAGPPWPRSVTWRDGELDALDLAWLPAEVRPAIEQLFAEKVAVERTRATEPTRAPGAAPARSSVAAWTPLHDACDRGHVEQVEQLLARGADVSARAPTARASATMRRVRHEAGSTPLHVAVFLGGATSPASVRALLAAGADANAVDDAGASAADRLGSSIDHAGSKIFAELVPLLAQAGARLDGAALGALRHENGVVLLALAEAGFDFDRPLDGGASLRARLEPVYELQWKKKRTVLNAASRASSTRAAP